MKNKGMAWSGTLITLPYMSSGVVSIGMALPVVLDIFSTPSVPGRMPVMMPTSGLWPMVSCNRRPATMILNN